MSHINRIRSKQSRLRLELLETRTLLAGDVFAHARIQIPDPFEPLDFVADIDTSTANRHDEVRDEKKEKKKGERGDRNEPQPEGEPSSGIGVRIAPEIFNVLIPSIPSPPAPSIEPPSELVPSQPTQPETPTLSVPEINSQLATSIVKPQSNSESVELNTQQNTFALDLTSETTSFDAAPLANSFNLSNRGELGQLDDSALAGRDLLFEQLSIREETSQNLRDLTDLLESLAKSNVKSEQSVTLIPNSGTDSIAPSNSGDAEEAALNRIRRQQDAEFDGMMALDVPADLLPVNELGDENEESVAAWTSPIGIYRPGQVGIAQAGAALSQTFANTSTTKRDIAQREQASEDWIVATARPWLATTSAAFGAIFIGLRRQKARDEQVRRDLEKLQ